MKQKLSALIVDSDKAQSSAAMRLREQEGEFQNIELAGDPQEAQQALGLKEESFDLVILAFSFDEAELLKIVEEGRNARRGYDSAYLLVLDESELESALDSLIPRFMDGFLFEPHAVAAPGEYAAIAKTVRERREEERERPALEFLLDDTLRGIDRIAAANASGEDKTHRLKYLESLRDAVTLSKKDLRGLYYNLAVEKAEKIVSRDDHTKESSE